MKNKIIKYFFLLATFLILPNFALATAPTISSVTGAISQNSTLTINGENMVQEDTAKWFISKSAAHNDGASPVADGWTQDGRKQAIYVTSPRLIGNHSVQYQIVTPGTETGQATAGDYLINYNVAENVPVHYVRGYVRYPASTTALFNSASSLKMFYWLGGSVYIEPKMTGGWPYSMMVKIWDQDTTLTMPYQWTPDRWICVEAMANYSTGNAQVWIDGTSIGTYHGAITSNPHYFLNGFINSSNDATAGTYTMYTAGLLESSTRVFPASTIEISGNCTDFPDCTGATWKYQPPTSLGETQSTVTADLPTKTVTNYVLKVTNNAQLIAGQSGTVFSLGTADTTAPSAPSGLSVQ